MLQSKEHGCSDEGLAKVKRLSGLYHCSRDDSLMFEHAVLYSDKIQKKGSYCVEATMHGHHASREFR